MTKIRNAYNAGADGETLDVGASKLQRVAALVGRVIHDPKGVDEADRVMYETHQKRFEQARDRAVGPNKTSMLILEAASNIPEEVNAEPLWGNQWLDPKSGLPVKHDWIGLFRSGPDKDLNRVIKKTQLVRPLGVIKVNNSDIPVDNISFVCTGKYREDGLSPVTTEIHINSGLEDDPYNNCDESDLTDTLRIVIDEQGKICTLGLKGRNGNGYSKEDPASLKTGFDDFLAGVLVSVSDTADAYNIDPDLSNL